MKPGCPTCNGDGAGTETAYSPGGDPLCPSWGSDAPQGHFGGSGWIPAICQRRSLMAMSSTELGGDQRGSLGKVAPVNFAQEGRCWRGAMHRAPAHTKTQSGAVPRPWRSGTFGGGGS